MLEQCFDSVLAQTCPAHQIIVVDDGSEDSETITCLEMYAARYPDRFLLKRNAHSGIIQSLNAGLRLLHSDWVCFLNSDDFFEADYLERLAGCISPDIDIVVGGGRCMNYSGGQSLGTFPTAEVLKDPMRYPYHTGDWQFRIYRRNCVQKYFNVFPEGCITFDMFNNLATLTARGTASVESYGYCHRVRADSTSRNFRIFNTFTMKDIPLADLRCYLAQAKSAPPYQRNVAHYLLACGLMLSSWLFCCYSSKAARIEIAEKTASFFREEELQGKSYRGTH